MLEKKKVISEWHFSFMLRKSTKDVMFTLKVLMEAYREGQKELHRVFVNLNKANDGML